MDGTILAVGDSGLVEKEDNSYDLYIKLLHTKIFTEYGKQTLLINKGISNTTTTEHVNNIPWWSDVTPDLIVYNGIGNDCVRSGQPATAAAARRNAACHVRTNAVKRYEQSP